MMDNETDINVDGIPKSNELEFWLFMFIIWSICSVIAMCCMWPYGSWIRYFIYVVFAAI
jgi:hypothetical protein